MSIFKGKNALVVDDEADLRDILKDELELHGFTVLTAENGMKAYDIAAKNKIDVIISDIRMPGGSGIDLLDKLNANNPRIPVLLFMSGFSDFTLDEAYHRGAAGILAKPFDTELLIEQLERLIIPIPTRWVRKPERIDVSLTVAIEIDGFKEAIAARVLNIGTGGMFIAVESELPVLGDLVGFKIHVKTPLNSSIHGQGTVRWVRPQNEADLKRGFGLEFQGLDEENAKLIFDIVESNQPRPFIPKD